MNLVIVESPTKAKMLDKFLGKGYKVLSSKGHVRDLPKSKISIDIEHDFTPVYEEMEKAKETIAILRKQAKEADSLFLATDPDREGEAIAWHLVQILDLDKAKSVKRKAKNYKRVSFHEITKEAVEEAFKNPREVDLLLVDAQQARRILDRLVGYKLSPLLWKKIRRGLSAGRVQSVTVRFIVEREREIEKFGKEIYFAFKATFSPKKGDNFDSYLEKVDDKNLEIKN
ncbi:DNA topoisomerase I, partial [candidate division WWE3 bacterium CG_4_10_14_0_2_um_filter_42_7]